MTGYAKVEVAVVSQQSESAPVKLHSWLIETRAISTACGGQDDCHLLSLVSLLPEMAVEVDDMVEKGCMKAAGAG